MPLVQHFSIEPGERVLDLCTGSGVIAIMAAYAGAGAVVALDSNPDAVRTARTNAALHRFAGVIDVRESDLFAAVAPGETFEVITMNPPYTPHLASDHVEASTWDSHFALHQRFFADVQQFLTPGGRIYLGQASFGPLARIQALATQAGFAIRLIGSEHVETELPRTYYAFQLTPRRSGQI
jgi:release factor glutamine methyltransferase